MTIGYFLFSGIIFGLSGGLTPGPLMVLVISETLRQGRGAGMKVGLAPLLTDFPIILIAWLVLTRLQNSQPVLGAIALVGSVYLGYLGWENVRYRQQASVARPLIGNPWLKGVLANLLNPSPYLFWFTIGVPLLLKASTRSWAHTALFALSFFSCLVGAKIAIALITDQSQQLLRSRFFTWMVRGLGVFLWVFALVFLAEGLKYFNLL